MCPGNNESGGRRRSGKTRNGSKWLAANLAEAAEAAGHSKDTYLGAQFQRLRGRLGHAKARKAVEHSMLVAAFHVLDRRVPYVDLGADWFQKRQPDAHARRLAHQIEALGYHVTIEPAEAARADHQLNFGTSSRAGLCPAPLTSRVPTTGFSCQ
jgi:transposase